MTEPRPFLHLPPHRLSVALLQPQIAPNTGNVARLCGATGTALHLARPLGFVLSDKELRRSAMDYWPRLKLSVHDDTAALLAASTAGSRWLFSSKGERPLWDAQYVEGDWLVFGSETRGIDEALLDDHRSAGRVLRIPQVEGERCLNLATAVGIALYEALRQVARQVLPRPSPCGA